MGTHMEIGVEEEVEIHKKGSHQPTAALLAIAAVCT
jgi:hypothetical protein